MTRETFALCLVCPTTPFNLPIPAGGYDPESARLYFGARPLQVLRRFLEGLYLTTALPSLWKPSPLERMNKAKRM